MPDTLGTLSFSEAGRRGAAALHEGKTAEQRRAHTEPMRNARRTAAKRIDALEAEIAELKAIVAGALGEHIAA